MGVNVERPLLLLTNDDGIDAPGLLVFHDFLRLRAWDIVVAAPDREQSGVSQALTLRRPLKFETLRPGWHAVAGTPADCVNLALFHLLPRFPDLVLSGINRGYNLGEDVYYSGTVAGAMEARILGARALAFSAGYHAAEPEFSRAAAVAIRVIELVLERGNGPETVLNVNIPPEPKGFRVTRLGRRADRRGLLTQEKEGEAEFIWAGLPPASWDEDPQADHAAVRDGFVSLTPLLVDRTCHEDLGRLEAWPWGEVR